MSRLRTNPILILLLVSMLLAACKKKEPETSGSIEAEPVAEQPETSTEEDASTTASGNRPPLR